MGMCPVCNNFHTINVRCPECGRSITDRGKVSDFFDDYSAYMEVDELKLEDGYKHDFKDSQCPHIFYCDSCHQEVMFFIGEW
ncbi:hypothetical protein [Fictibacillus barbaricus]|uniref:Uncharacterized protein n=1 Tax=Fictibacillus barbaricus TaxID=182136 RepID=A0ABU1TV79_9BACL|nr:hypothetical protein [Fictibacillus barbaricus]MDR7071119.1 hypothetical protein [Fictibacillus barbaricus]